LLAGVYYPVEVLPDWLQAISRLLPATYSTAALRRVMLGSGSFSTGMQDLLALVGFALLLLPVGLVALRIAVRWAKIDGSLAQY
jgi:ABC-2 type transport system permease protein